MTDERILRFNPPPSWPIPNDAWQIAYAGWTPPVDWRPPGVDAAAPAGWRFWLPNEPMWSNTLRMVTASLRRSQAIQALILVVGLVVSIASFASAAPGGTYVVFGGAVVWGLIGLIRATVRRASASRLFLEAIHQSAPRRIEEHKRAMYADYLRRVSAR